MCTLYISYNQIIQHPFYKCKCFYLFGINRCYVILVRALISNYIRQHQKVQNIIKYVLYN